MAREVYLLGNVLVANRSELGERPSGLRQQDILGIGRPDPWMIDGNCVRRRVRPLICLLRIPWGLSPVTQLNHKGHRTKCQRQMHGPVD